ncbi:MAG: putative metalloprotease CJM1_0395 family protein [Candidatus Latescibacterota bacterium]
MSSILAPITGTVTSVLWQRSSSPRASGTSPTAGAEPTIPVEARADGNRVAGEESRDSVEIGTVPPHPSTELTGLFTRPEATAPARAASLEPTATEQRPLDDRQTDEPTGEEDLPEDGSDAATGSAERSVTGEELVPAEQREVQELRTRDREVKAHEQAHLAAAGPYAQGGPQYEYQTGPDGKQYAVGGEVGIDTSRVADDPEATIRKAQVVRRAALAPAEPSPQDRRIAAEASRMESQARQELSRKERQDDQTDRGEASREPSPKGDQPETDGSSIPEATSPTAGATWVSGGVATLTRPRTGQVLDLVA